MIEEGKQEEIEVLKGEVTRNAKKKLKVKKQIAISSKRKEKYLVAEIAFLTTETISKVIDYCIGNTCNETYFILLCLFTGRSKPKVKNIKLVTSDSELSFCFDCDYKKQPVPKDYKKLYRPTSKSVDLPLPISVFRKFEGYDFLDIDNEKVSVILKNIKDQNSFPNRITLKKISEYLSFYLTNNNFNSSDIAILTSKLSDLSSGIHYYRPSIGHLQNVYLNFVNHLLDISNSNKIAVKKQSTNHIGSEYVLKDQAVSLHFKLLSEKIKNLNKSCFVEKYNLFTLYTLEILNLSTAHRPVYDPFQYLNNFNLIQNCVYICDKKRDSALPFRFGILCKIAKQQFEYYLAYLEKIKITEKFSVDGLSHTIDKMLDSHLPIFQFITQKGFESVHESTIDKVTKDIFPVKPNWHRHFMKNQLSVHNVSGKCIDMYMGHDGGGDYSLAKYSHDSVYHLQSISRTIDQIMKSLNIEALKIS